MGYIPRYSHVHNGETKMGKRWLTIGFIWQCVKTLYPWWTSK
jgi:hypothetical protein